jgi:F-type H+-transporting ATPase subunit a
MLFLEAAAHAAAAAAHGAAGAAEAGAHEERPAFHTGSLLTPLYEAHILNAKVLPEEVLISLITAVGLIVAVMLLTRRLDLRRPSKTQAALELVVSSLNNMVTGLIGPEGPRYLPMIATLFIYILVLNLSGLIPLWKSPTSNLHVTLALALSAFFYVQYQGIRANGLGGYLKHFVGEPAWLAPLNIPIHIIGELARPVSLCFRLFGNIFGEDVVIAILILIGTMIAVPLPFHIFMLPLAAFTSFLQAMVFTMLTCIYIAGFVAHEHGHEHEHDHGHGHGDEQGVLTQPLPAPPA